jgi:hypothetical protein
MQAQVLNDRVESRGRPVAPADGRSPKLRPTLEINRIACWFLAKNLTGRTSHIAKDASP